MNYRNPRNMDIDTPEGMELYNMMRRLKANPPPLDINLFKERSVQRMYDATVYRSLNFNRDVLSIKTDRDDGKYLGGNGGGFPEGLGGKQSDRNARIYSILDLLKYVKSIIDKPDSNDDGGGHEKPEPKYPFTGHPKSPRELIPA